MTRLGTSLEKNKAAHGIFVLVWPNIFEGTFKCLFEIDALAIHCQNCNGMYLNLQSL